MLSEQFINSLKSVLNKNQIISDNDLLIKYFYDHTKNIKGECSLAVIPQSTEDVSNILKLCYKYEVPVFPRGAGTGVSGGAIPNKDGLVISFEKMNKIIEIDKDNLIAVVQPGVINSDLKNKLLEYNLFYPPDPASLDSCSLGGNVASNAGGPSAVKYGTTKDYITGIEFVLSDGKIIQHGGKIIKNSTGINLTGLITGSEGILAIITKIYLKLIPLPMHSIDLLIPFDSFNEAIQSVSKLLTNKILPSIIEFMDYDSIKLVNDFLNGNIPFPAADAHLVLQLVSDTEDGLYNQLDIIFKSINVEPENIIIAQSQSQKQRLWTARRSIRKAIENRYKNFFAEDCVVPRAKIADYVIDVKSQLKQYNIKSVVFGHAGDGNVHIDILQDNINEKEFIKLTPEIKDIIYNLAYKYNGLITGEHGIGLIKKDFFKKFHSKDEIKLIKKIKKAFDPKNIINPGKIIDLD